MTATVIALSALLGLGTGIVVNRLANAFPWPSRGGGRPAEGGAPGPADLPSLPSAGTSAGRRSTTGLAERPGILVAVRPRAVAVGTAALFALTALRFGASWELPAFLYLAGVGVLLAVIDMRHHLLPNRVLVPSYGVSAALLLVPSAVTGEWSALLRAGSAAILLFGAFLVLALISPGALGMGDVKLAALVGLYLGWLGWATLFLGAAAGFVVQAAVALVLLGLRRIGLRGELPFGPAMLVGAAVATTLTSHGAGI